MDINKAIDLGFDAWFKDEQMSAYEYWADIESSILVNSLLEKLRSDQNLNQDSILELRREIFQLAPDNWENKIELMYLANEFEVLEKDFDWLSIPARTLERYLLLCMEHSKLDLIEGIIQVFDDEQITLFVNECFRLFYQKNQKELAIRVLELCHQHHPYQKQAIFVLEGFYNNIYDFDHSLAMVEKYEALDIDNLAEKLFLVYLRTRSYLGAGKIDLCLAMLAKYKAIAQQILDLPTIEDFSNWNCRQLLISGFFFPYTQDQPEEFRRYQNQLGKLAVGQLNLLRSQLPPSKLESIQAPPKSKKLRIGYLASTFKIHSVGWLARWIFRYSDRSKIENYLYCLYTDPNTNFHLNNYRQHTDFQSYFETDLIKAAEQIQADEIDILVELDSLTFDTTLNILSAKPAPIIISWLGWDAPGLPTVDYYIADPYVLPENAQDYYQEKILRLPSTYLAIDGFEVGVPTLRREDLGVSPDAILYLTAQSGYKRHPETIKLQMEVVSQVPNAYLLIKGSGDWSIAQEIFYLVAEKVGFDRDRLIFLNRDPDEYTHRANLTIADVVLDTFPYNGATTTLETLWMGIPLVTKVGQQFSARNSYTFMINAGITEGIAWTDEEYIDWGIRLGKEPDLRALITNKLRSSRQTAPVWNTRQFTQDLESTYLRLAR